MTPSCDGNIISVSAYDENVPLSRSVRSVLGAKTTDFRDTQLSPKDKQRGRKHNRNQAEAIAKRALKHNDLHDVKAEL
jgi:hypothetical protein